MNPIFIMDLEKNNLEDAFYSKALIAFNLIFEGKYHDAIKILEKLLQEELFNDYHELIHCNLMQAYFKIRLQSSENIDKCNHHAKMAMILGHNTGFVAERIIINLTKEKKFSEALDVCDFVANSEYKLSSNGMKKHEFQKRLLKLIKRFPKVDSKPYFSDQEKAEMIRITIEKGA